MRAIILAAWLVAVMALAQSEKAIIPVTAWPTVIHMDGKTFYGADVAVCVNAGYRLIPAKPSAPTGKQIKSEKLVQDDKDAAMCKYEITYEDIPAPPVVPPVAPEVLTNVASAKVQFQFTTNGEYRGVTWVDAPKSNSVIEEK